jgi:CBS domain-containing protein
MVVSQKKITKLQEMVHELKVSDVMTRNPITIAPESRMSDLREILRVNRISGLPVVDGGRLIGVVSVEDFIKTLTERQNGCTVREKMTTEVQTLSRAGGGFPL